MVKTARKEGLMDFYVGIDVSKFKHTVAIIDEEGEIRKKSFDISNSREGFDSLLNELGLLGEKEQIRFARRKRANKNRDGSDWTLYELSSEMLNL